MSIRPVDLQVAVPRMAEVEKSHKAQEQPQYNQTFASEVKQMLLKKELEVQRHDDAQQVKLRDQEKRGGQHGDTEQDRQRQSAPSTTGDTKTQPVSDGVRGRRLDIRI